MLAAVAALLCVTPCAAKGPKKAAKAAETEKYVFTDVRLCPQTSVKDQNKSGTCWSFAGSGFFEDEIRRAGGDSLDLSEMFAVHHCYLDKAQRFMKLGGHAKLGSGGTALDVAYVWRRYGMVPEEVYSGLQYGEDKHYHNEMQNGVAAYMDAVVKKPNKRLSTVWPQALEGILSAYLGQMPDTFTYKGKTYTPRTFADAQPINIDDYVAITSFNHQPWYKPYPLETADNWRSEPWYNVPMEDMLAILDNAVEQGYPVAWSTDVSEPSFHWRDGYANYPAELDNSDMTDSELARWVTLTDDEQAGARYKSKGPVKEMTVTQDMRQQMYDRKETGDDHGMVIVGYATDQTGARFYKAKNSWDTNQVYGGYLYVSQPYFLAKSMGIYLNRNAIPQPLRDKLGL